MNLDASESGELAAIFSRKARVGGIGQTPERRRVEATADECKTLAGIFKLPDIARLTGDFELTCPRGRGVIQACLALRATVTQNCVVSLELFESEIEETSALVFMPAGLREDADIAELDQERLEAPDEIPYTGDVIDLGAALAEQLALALDPYPRKPGAELPENTDDAAAHPFAALAARRAKPANDPD